MEAKLKHLEFIQAAIARMATNSFLFKGWAMTIAVGIAAFAAADTKAGVITIALVSTVMFWGLDGYYLWLERGFRRLHSAVAAKNEADIDFAMKPDTRGFVAWVKTCLFPPHLWVFYGSILVVEVIGIVLIRST